MKACEITEHLKSNWKLRNNEVFMNSRETNNYIKTELGITNAKNLRQVKKDILERAVKLFPNIVCIVRSKSGNKETGIALKPSAKRTDTYGC